MTWVIGAVFCLGGCLFGYAMSEIMVTLRAIHKEMVLMRAATKSLHDQIVPEVLLRKAMRSIKGKP